MTAAAGIFTQRSLAPDMPATLKTRADEAECHAGSRA